jgi:hypothetical protein
MNPPNVEEIASVVVNDDVSTIRRDIRPAYQKQLAVNIILVCLLLQTMVFYLYGINIIYVLSSIESLRWSGEHSITAGEIFDGKLYLKYTILANAILLSLIIGTNIAAMVIFAIITDPIVGKAKMMLIGNTLK